MDPFFRSLRCFLIQKNVHIPLYCHAALCGVGQGSVEEMALRYANNHIDRLEKNAAILNEELEKCRNDVGDWKTLFMNLRTHTEKCPACKPFAAAVIS